MKKKDVALIMNNTLRSAGVVGDEILPENVVELPATQYEKELAMDYEIYMARFRSIILKLTVRPADNYSVEFIK